MNMAKTESGGLALDYTHANVGKALILHADCLEWLGRIPAGSMSRKLVRTKNGRRERTNQEESARVTSSINTNKQEHVRPARIMAGMNLEVNLEAIQAAIREAGSTSFLSTFSRTPSMQERVSAR